MTIERITPEQIFYQNARHILEQAMADINRLYMELQAARSGGAQQPVDMVLIDPRTGTREPIRRRKGVK